MKVIIDNNLPVTLAQAIRKLECDHEIHHVSELGLQTASDSILRRRWKDDAVVWVTRDYPGRGLLDGRPKAMGYRLGGLSQSKVSFFEEFNRACNRRVSSPVDARFQVAGG